MFLGFEPICNKFNEPPEERSGQSCEGREKENFADFPQPGRAMAAIARRAQPDRH